MYDDATMEDIKFTDLDHVEREGKKAVVSCVVSKVSVRRFFAGSGDMQSLVCKTRVLVAVRQAYSGES